jgi:ATP-binding cassette subfamily B protein
MIFKFKSRLPFFYQTNSTDCGLACLRMIIAFYGKNVSIEYLRKVSDFEKTGTSLYGLYKAAESFHFEVKGALVEIEELSSIINDIPVIVHWKGNHFVVLYGMKNDKYIIADPGKGKISLTKEEFISSAFYSENNNMKMANVLLIYATPLFTSTTFENNNSKSEFKFLLSYIKNYKNYYILIVWSLILGLGIQMLLPFITKSVVDKGIESKNIKYVFYILLGQVVFILSSTFFSIIRSWITLNLSSRINFSLISTFIVKLFNVQISFFETRKIGDILQRIGDNSRIEIFISRLWISVVFSILTIIFYSVILAYYQIGFFWIIFCAMILYSIWATIFLEKRKEIDWRRFDFSSRNHSNIIQIVNGIHDLKINNSEKKFYEKWQQNQNLSILNNFESLKLSQYQDTGATLIMQLTQIFITFLSVKLVIQGTISFGIMISIQFIIGQLLIPIQQIIGFIGSAQDAKLSYERLNDVWTVRNESENRLHANPISIKTQENLFINFKNVSFCYPGQESFFSLDNISFSIDQGKTTAIVGLSGSGKTSILKLLLGYYSEYSGEIYIGDMNFKELDLDDWRTKCGVVMQDSFIFNESIAENICMSKKFDLDKLKNALEITNMWDYINTLPQKYETIIGSDGKGLSQGQKQRLLIARAVYKDPEFIFFDEATNALDSNNENIIMLNLKKFFKGKTVLFVAHRLSTIQFADKIILLENGKILEYGTHIELKIKNGRYHELIRNQMEN